jgi:hypothetical protein
MDKAVKDASDKAEKEREEAEATATTERIKQV